MSPDTYSDTPTLLDSEFDLRARAELAIAFEASDAPAHLYLKQQPLLARRFLAALLLVGGASGGVLAVRPPAMVRDAIDHEYHERTLRGSFMEQRQLLMHLGMREAKVLPGFPQLMRPCDIEGHLAYHLTTFFEKGGMVTVYAFDQPVDLREASGWWSNVHWKVIRSREGKPLLLVAQKKKALAVAQTALQVTPVDGPG
ncbi:MAG: hypothetical protein V4794_04285 [Pseudomonadota bacterium]|jgi:hypothetical protein|uniref:hypothetical protein n=1 Tax=Hydrogenophaga sp. TaxID=1904254 RepID=UPI0033448836